jgi:hypothetical protein
MPLAAFFTVAALHAFMLPLHIVARVMFPHLIMAAYAFPDIL